MDSRVPADDGGWRRPSGGPPQDTVEQRLAAIEARLAGLEKAVAESVQTAGDEMRRAVSDLGRLLLRDLDRLTKVLAEHRDTIVERLLPDEEPAPVAPAPEAPGAASPVTEPPRLAGEAGRWKTFPARRRRRRRRPA